MSTIKFSNSVLLSGESVDFSKANIPTNSIGGMKCINPSNSLGTINLRNQSYTATQDCWVKFQHYHNNASWTGYTINGVPWETNYNANSGYTTQYYSTIPLKAGSTVARWNDVHYDGDTHAVIFGLSD